MLQKPGWDRSRERWLAFWESDLVDRPPVLVHIVASEGLDVGESASLESTIAHYEAPENEAALEQAEEHLLDRASRVRDDMPPAMTAGGGVYYTGAVFGAPLRVTADMMTSEPILHDWSRAGEIRYSLENVWARRAMDLASRPVARSRGRYAVTPGLLEGPSDICASLRSPTRLACDLYEYPAEVHGLALMAVDAWKTHAMGLYDRIPLYDGGTVTQWSIWVPGRGAALQEDFSSVVSPSQYRAVFLPLDRELARCADVTWMHIHSGAIHLVEEVLRAEEIRGVQIVQDGVAGPALAKVIPVMQRVQQSGRCLIIRKYSLEELVDILPHLSPRRLAIDTYCTDVDRANRWVDSLDPWPWAAVGG